MGKEKRQSPSTLLWFIRHKSYVPISEIRRRFLVESEDGSFIQAGKNRRAYVGLPQGTAQSLEKLWQQGKIGLEFSVEFDADVLIGVYPMNPAKEHFNGNGYVPVHVQAQQPVPVEATDPAGRDVSEPNTDAESGETIQRAESA
jgi:hypothetical protein